MLHYSYSGENRILKTFKLVTEHVTISAALHHYCHRDMMSLALATCSLDSTPSACLLRVLELIVCCKRLC